MLLSADSARIQPSGASDERNPIVGVVRQFPEDWHRKIYPVEIKRQFQEEIKKGYFWGYFTEVPFKTAPYMGFRSLSPYQPRVSGAAT